MLSHTKTYRENSPADVPSLSIFGKEVVNRVCVCACLNVVHRVGDHNPANLM